MNHNSFITKSGQILFLIVLLLTVLFNGRNSDKTAAANGTQTGHIYLPLLVNKGTDDGEQPSGPMQIYAYSDAAVIQPNAMLQPLLSAQKPILCRANELPQTLTFSQAQQNGWNYLSQQIGVQTVHAFRHAAEVNTADKAQAFAMAAMVDNRPDGALAALLQAHDLNPHSPIILVNAAGLLASLNMPNEALAFLDAAVALPSLMETPMGIPGEELAANARGYALLQLGQWPAAEDVLRPLAESDSELSEARLNLSLALLCQGEDEEAMHFYRLGSRRLMWDVVEYGEEVEGIRPPVDLTFDRSVGKQFTLPPLGVMNTPSQANAVLQHTNGLIDEGITRVSDLNALTEANIALREARPLPGPHTLARFANIMITASRAKHEPDVQALYDALVEQENGMNELMNEQLEEWEELEELLPDITAYTAACHSTITGHLSIWLTEYFQFEDLLEQYTAQKYYAATSIAAHLADPLHHEYVSLLIENDMETDIAWRLHILNGYAGRTATLWSFCEGIEESVQTQSSEPTFDRAEKCPMALGRNKIGVNLIPEVLQVRGNCELMDVELSGPTLLTVFGQVTHDRHNKAVTFFAGAKIKSPPGMVQLATNEGFYLTVGEDGIRDLGMKLATSVDIGAGGIVGVFDGEGMELGVADAVAYWNGSTTP